MPASTEVSDRDELQAHISTGIAELRVLCLLVLSMLPGRNKQARQADEWLRDLLAAMDGMDALLTNGDFELCSINIGDSEVCDLDQALDLKPELGVFATKYPGAMLDFWMREIQRRGRELVEVVLGTVSIVDFIETQQQLRQLRYPVQ